MKLAFLILGHKYPEKILNLIDILGVDGDHLFIHIDRRAADTFDKILKESGKYNNVFLIEKRVAPRWGQFSIVQATLNSLSLINGNNETYSHVILISGQDYPLKSIYEIKDYLNKHRDKQFIEYFSIHENNRWTEQGSYFQSLRRVYHWHFFLRKYHIYIPVKRRIPNGLEPFGGHQWWVLTGDCVNYLLEYVRNNPRVTRFFRNTFIPDELFIQTILCNSKYKYKLTGYNLTYTDWEHPNPFPPRVLTEEDIASADESQALFARKIEPGRSDGFIRFFKESIP